MLNIEKIREYTGADDEFIAMLFKKFLDHLEEDLEELRSETTKKNWVNVRKKTHAMLSSARIFHLEEIVALSMKIEKKVDEVDFEELEGMVEKLIEYYEEFRLEVEGWLPK